MKTAQSVSTIATTGPLTCSIARTAAARGDLCSVRMMRSTFSRTKMASSTTMPRASTSPNNVKRLIENPRRYIPAKVPMRETGTPTTGISVARQLCRKMKTTATTSKIAAAKVFSTSSMETSTKRVVLKGIRYSMPSGKRVCGLSIVSLTFLATSSALAPGWR
jgi:hypothetical protein